MITFEAVLDVICCKVKREMTQFMVAKVTTTYTVTSIKVVMKHKPQRFPLNLVHISTDHIQMDH